MTYAFIIVVSVAITLKLMFMSFSLYVTLKEKRQEATQGVDPIKQGGHSLAISWKRLQKALLPRYSCPEPSSKTVTHKL